MYLIKMLTYEIEMSCFVSIVRSFAYLFSFTYFLTESRIKKNFSFLNIIFNETRPESFYFVYLFILKKIHIHKTDLRIN